MMRLNLQLTMGTFSLSLFGLMGVAFGMNLESSLEEVRMQLQVWSKVICWLVSPGMLSDLPYVSQAHLIRDGTAHCAGLSYIS